MRTNIVIDEKLISDAIKATGARTKREAVELGLKALIQLKNKYCMQKRCLECTIGNKLIHLPEWGL